MQPGRRRPRLSLDLLKGFESAARHLSFTRAAEELSLTQSAISREIKTLEAQLGQPLFERVNRGLRLTAAGVSLQRAVGKALALIDEATDGLAAPRRPERLTVTTSVPLASLWLVPRLAGFTRLHPEVDVRIVATNLVVDLERERLDLAIRWAHEAHEIEGAPLFEMRIFPVCSPALAADRARPLAGPADLAHHVLLDLEIDTARGPWTDWGSWLGAMHLGSLRPAGTLCFSHYDQVTQAAMDGSGVAIGRLPHNARLLRDGRLVAPFGREGALDWGRYYTVAAPRSQRRAVVALFVDWLHGEVARDVARDACAGGDLTGGLDDEVQRPVR
jgi:LysR family transcriptional regulator, glycine cleavage system transcriptional activator